MSKHIVVRFPSDMRRQLKVAAARHKVTMGDALVQAFLEWDAAQAEKASRRVAKDGRATKLAILGRNVVSTGDARKIEAALCVLESLARA
jgi:hypothetical protein